jgi:prepilin-type N-terminal cleavage/methylation domain-containing protein
MTRASRRSGFTLPELMAVVCIVGIVAALAARMYGRGIRGEAAPGFARSLMASMLDARHSAMALGRTSRVTLSPSASSATPAMTVLTETYNPTTSGWDQQSTLSVPTSMQLCLPVAAVQLGTIAAPTCPLTAAKVICFYPNGRVDQPPSGACATSSPATGTGTTIYFESNDAAKKYRLWVWGLTGMVKLIDQW